jgi:undecaprenyl pyrophosphate phosphatase UppP
MKLNQVSCCKWAQVFLEEEKLIFFNFLGARYLHGSLSVTWIYFLSIYKNIYNSIKFILYYKKKAINFSFYLFVCTLATILSAIIFFHRWNLDLFFNKTCTHNTKRKQTQQQKKSVQNSFWFFCLLFLTVCWILNLRSDLIIDKLVFDFVFLIFFCCFTSVFFNSW